MGIQDFLNKPKEEGMVSRLSVLRHLGGKKLPNDMKALYALGRYQMGYNTQCSVNYPGAVRAFEKLCQLDLDFQYPNARKWLGQCWLLGKGVQQDVNRGSGYYNAWLKNFLLTETDLALIDRELRAYFDLGFHSYSFLLDCADKRVQIEKTKTNTPLENVFMRYSSLSGFTAMQVRQWAFEASKYILISALPPTILVTKK